MWGMDNGKRFAEKRMRDTADLRKDTRYIGMASTLYCRKASIIIKIIISLDFFVGRAIAPATCSSIRLDT